MTLTSPMPAPAQSDAPYAAVPEAALAPTPAAVQQALTPPRRRRLDPAQVWTIVVAGVIGLVAVLTSIAVGVSGSEGGDDRISRLFEDGGAGISDYYEYYDDSDCYDAFC